MVLSKPYTDLSGLVKHNHIFTCNLDEHEIIRHTAVWRSRGIRNDIEKLRTRSAALLQPISLMESTRTNGLNCSSSTAPLFLLNITKEFYIKPSDDVLKMVKEEKVIQIENRAKMKAVKEDKTGYHEK